MCINLLVTLPSIDGMKMTPKAIVNKSSNCIAKGCYFSFLPPVSVGWVGRDGVYVPLLEMGNSHSKIHESFLCHILMNKFL